ncbi:hypothetical protein ACFL08_02185 [Patescibacteria group bacterium]
MNRYRLNFSSLTESSVEGNYFIDATNDAIGIDIDQWQWNIDHSEAQRQTWNQGSVKSIIGIKMIDCIGGQRFVFFKNPITL